MSLQIWRQGDVIRDACPRLQQELEYMREKEFRKEWWTKTVNVTGMLALALTASERDPFLS